MPELPEVETTRRGISPHVEGRLIVALHVRQPKLRWLVPELIQQAVGHRILSVRRRAKYLILDTEVGSIVLHLGMSGSLTIQPAGKAPTKHDHVDLVLEDGNCLRLNDPRRFGACLWQASGETLELLQGLGPEPLTDDFDGERLYQLSRKRSGAVKNFVMSNAVVVGVGNIYANEALFMSGIDPRKPAGKLSRARCDRLAESIKQVLARAIEKGGTTLRDFLGADGKPGYFRIELSVYGKAGEPCPKCGNLIQSRTIGQRNSFYCSNCQR
ncbi:bifunctional DNA-formamidopyrimidine glycosylase/DNA-(apurinic or apyrimidinic site) lyase [Coraliomargarita akajimensis]|uniref:Formamidopyrimidine-DNA glycosylase n=1 Tax=Coraliomargarita akajimensis (strain DSM 45221 / IAM 15411 / JCM 23193 / KCTC 12865 / 04OKA010-24) TaxID=583355 RepID=D5EJH0_CORAD|nr:bifunctional DNA-formamidopyrimidine glycosylase/DNA-(apurinic or apyrimidinic site) lyase [Coraliomargarita akajimensis]ADE54569.1 formamidopyrimidine-DNA glycosylase [Coraliomargarita akajimensis DSM 45221]